MDSEITTIKTYEKFDNQYDYYVLCTDIILENIIYTLEEHFLDQEFKFAHVKELVNKNVNEISIYSTIKYNNNLYRFRYHNLSNMLLFFLENNTENIEKFKIKSHDKKSMEYFDIDGIIYTETNFNRMKELTLYPAGKKDKEYIVPDFVSKIDLEAFFNNKFIKRLTIKNKNVQFLGELKNTTLINEINLFDKKIIKNKFGRWMLQKK